MISVLLSRELRCQGIRNPAACLIRKFAENNERQSKVELLVEHMRITSARLGARVLIGDAERILANLRVRMSRSGDRINTSSAAPSIDIGAGQLICETENEIIACLSEPVVQANAFVVRPDSRRLLLLVPGDSHSSTPTTRDVCLACLEGAQRISPHVYAQILPVFAID